MPSYRSVHLLAKTEDYIVNGWGGHKIDMGQEKYTALCGYIGFSRDGFANEHKGVTCLRCKKKMRANTASTGIAVGSDKPALSASENQSVAEAGSPALR